MDRTGLIIKSISGEYVVLVDSQEYVCKPIGLMRYKNIIPRVGDYCIIDDNDGKAVIKEIKKRKNELLRPIVANVDKVIIVTSLKKPDLNLNLLDRLICQVEYSDIPIVLVFSKVDLVNIDEYLDIINYYKKIGYKVYITPKEINSLKEEFADSICVLAGQSGVGKSNLINQLGLGFNLETGEISDALGRGKHTTRHVQLHKVGSGYLADTPGFGALDLEMDEASLGQTFVEFFKCKCKYNPCFHISEPDCIVKDEVNKGNILKSRYDNYLLFLKEIKENKNKRIYKNKEKK